MRLSEDIQSPRLLYFKGSLFVLLGLVSASILFFRVPRLDVAILLMICVWSACRAYYFAFYVIQHYIDPEYRFAGLFDFAKYLVIRRRHVDHSQRGVDDE